MKIKQEHKSLGLLFSCAGTRIQWWRIELRSWLDHITLIALIGLDPLFGETAMPPASSYTTNGCTIWSLMSVFVTFR